MFTQELMQFSNNLDALREFVQDVAPLLRANPLKGLTDDPQSVLLLLYILDEIVPDNSGSSRLLPGIDWEALKRKFKDKIIIEKNEVTDQNPNWVANIKIQGDIDQFRFQETISKLYRRSRNTELLYKNSLIALVSAAEWFLAQLLHQFYKQHPDAIGGGRDKVFSLEDLRNFDTVEEARMSLIESKIENLLRDNISTWFKCLKEKPFELSLGYLSPYDSRFAQI